MWGQECGPRMRERPCHAPLDSHPDTPGTELLHNSKSWCWIPGSNRWPAAYETAALPTELIQPCRFSLTIRDGREKRHDNVALSFVAYRIGR